jgi:hemolysin activation/secretion protein
MTGAVAMQPGGRAAIRSIWPAARTNYARISCILLPLLILPTYGNAQPAERQPQFDPRQAEKAFEAIQREQRRNVHSVTTPTLSQAQPAADPTPFMTLGSVAVAGARSIGPAVIAGAYKSYIGKVVSQADLAHIAEAIGQLYRDAGYHLSRAIVPPQDIKNGRVVFRVIEGRITDIVLKGEGAERFGARRFLEPIRQENPSRLGTLERQLLLVNEQPGMRVTDSALEEIGSETGNFRLTVLVRTWGVESFAAIDNLGSAAIGPLEGFLSSQLNSAFVPGDALTFNASTAPNAPKELGFGRISYDQPIGSDGFRLGASAWYGTTWPGDWRSEIHTHTDSAVVELRGSIVPIDTQKWTLRFFLATDVGDYIERDDFGTDYDDRVRQLLFGIDTSFSDGFNGRDYLGLIARQGLDILDASQVGNPLTSHFGASGVFSVVDLTFSRYQPLAGAWSYRFSAAAQYASAPLLISQQFYLGGAAFGRGFDAGEISGDDGVAASLELRFDQDSNWKPVQSYQLYGFVDSGAVWDYNNQFGVLSLISAGIGARLYAYDNWQAGLAVAVPLSYRTGTNDRQGTRLLFSLSKSMTECPDRPLGRCL